ncbi:GRIM-19 protein-domain-containing protein [Zopfochytrium polystomum]|nr:GRIM-19 protein-domain-containing protein [Zopfochytrium polystomum]
MAFTAADPARRAVQDTHLQMPETIKYTRNIPRRGPSGAVLFLAMFGVMGYGWYWTIQSNHERRELRREKAWARIHLVPLLQAETDRDIVRRIEASKAAEYEVMKDSVPDWSPLDLKAKVKGVGRGGVFDETQSEAVYNTERYVPPTFFFVPKEENRVKPDWWRGTKMVFKNPPYHERADWKGKENPLEIA